MLWAAGGKPGTKDPPRANLPAAPLQEAPLMQSSVTAPSGAGITLLPLPEPPVPRPALPPVQNVNAEQDQLTGEAAADKRRSARKRGSLQLMALNEKSKTGAPHAISRGRAKVMETRETRHDLLDKGFALLSDGDDALEG